MKRTTLPAVIPPFAKENKAVTKSIGKVYQKACAFDIIKEHRDQLSEVNRKLHTLVKSTSKGQGTIMSQLLGQKMQLEKTIEAIFAGVK